MARPLKHYLRVTVLAAVVGVGAGFLLGPNPLFAGGDEPTCLKNYRCGGLNCYPLAVVDCRPQEVGGCSYTVCGD